MDVPAEDPVTCALIQKADTVGVFQSESREGFGSYGFPKAAR